ncbi:Mitochondrial chaperone BCS1 [Mycena indigotica]|uniref:Mitochondrial chaperone BCS1 n=1 Tax=Mycena indigotica TaxID=2126181 RepID=A0A8H6SRC1_9AGAR|nr:Mitochondrial chaperone BCS1 [Mycena indigotica]KAF7303788.1 Mitochondrial chaperone BCS1 [Mycena indigotica]
MKIGRYSIAPQLQSSRYSQKPPKRQSKPVEPARPPRKKALLIGIAYNSDEEASSSPGLASLKGPHKDVDEMYSLVVDKYAYLPENVVILRDNGHDLQPTRHNILRAIDELVQDAGKGDRFFFHYCGHTIQVENRSNSEEDGMDECLVPADGEFYKIQDNELRRHLVDPLPPGTCLVAVFDSCHSASLLDLTHFRCNRIYVPWISKGRRLSNELWNAVVRKHALPLSKPATPIHSPPTSRAATHADLSATPALVEPRLRRLTRRATREAKEFIQLNKSSAAPERVPTRPASPTTVTTPNSPIVTTRRIYEAARTSSRRLQGWRTDVNALEIDIAEESTTEPLARAETDGGLRKSRRFVKATMQGKRASLPLVPFQPAPLVEGQSSTRRRRTTVSRARAVSLSPRNATIERQAGKENVIDSNARPSLKLSMPAERPMSWLGEDHECDSPAPVWECDGNCRDRTHTHDEERAEVISLASCKDHQLSWEDSEGGSMTRELVRILNQDPHPTLRALMMRVSYGLHATTLDRHLATRKYKRKVKKYLAMLAKRPRIDQSRGPDSIVTPPTPNDAASLSPIHQLAELNGATASSKTPARQPKHRKATRYLPGGEEELTYDMPRPPQNRAQSEGFPVLEMDNFQDPQLASHRPLNLETQWSI